MERQRSISPVLLIILIIVLGLSAYSNSFHCSFQFDDWEYVLGSKTLGLINGSSDGLSLLRNPTRIVGYFSFALNYLFSGTNPTGYHIVNFTIHILNTFIVWIFILLLFNTPKGVSERGSKHKNIIAYFTALIFLLHPMQTQAVTYITQRLASLAAFFYISTLCLYIKGRLTSKREHLYFISAFFTAILGMFTKENVFTLPFAVILIEIFFFDYTFNILKRFKKTHLFFILLCFLVFLCLVPAMFKFNFKHIFVSGVVSGSHDSDILGPYSYLLTQFRVILKYIRLLIFPVGMNLDYDFAASYSFFDRETLLSFLVLFLIFISAIKLYPKNRFISFGIIWFFLTLSVESSIIPIHHVIYDHRIYLPSIGLFLAFVVFITGLTERKYLMIILLATISCVLALLTFQRNKVWKTEVSLWKDVIKKSPNKARGYYNLANIYYKKNLKSKSLAYYNEAIRLNPGYYSAYNNRGIVFKDLNRPDLSVLDYSKAINLMQNYYEAYDNRGIAYSIMGKFDLAMNDFNKAIELNPIFSDAYSNRGIIYGQKRNYMKAIADFSKAISLNNNNINAYMNRAITYANMKKYNLALKDFSKATKLAPKRKDILEQLHIMMNKKIINQFPKIKN